MRYPDGQEDISSCSTRRLVLLSTKKTCASRSTSRHWRHVLHLDKKTCLLVQQEGMSSSSTRRHVFLLNKKTRCLVEQEDMSFLLDKNTCLLVEQENMPTCFTRRHVFLLDKRKRRLVHGPCNSWIREGRTGMGGGVCFAYETRDWHLFLKGTCYPCCHLFIRWTTIQHVEFQSNTLKLWC